MNTEFQGEVSLVVMEEPRAHRFKISVAGEDVMVVWLEDRASKLQWQTRELEKADFVTEENAIPRAKLTDYAKRFAECLGGTGGTDIMVEWAMAPDNSPTLKLVLPLQWSSYVATVHYMFRMEQVDLKPVDLVAARLSDVEEKQEGLVQSLGVMVQSFDAMVKNPDGDGKSLLEQVRDIKRCLEGVPRGYSATTTASSKTNEALVWTASGGSFGLPQLVEFRTDGTIMLGADSAYAVVTGIKHSSTTGEATCQLLHNKKVVVYTTEKAKSTVPVLVCSMNHVLLAKKGDTLQFVFKGNNEAKQGSYVTVWRLP